MCELTTNGRGGGGAAGLLPTGLLHLQSRSAYDTQAQINVKCPEPFAASLSPATSAACRPANHAGRTRPVRALFNSGMPKVLWAIVIVGDSYVLPELVQHRSTGVATPAHQFLAPTQPLCVAAKGDAGSLPEAPQPQL